MGGALMFPGQGAQSPGMGAPWCDHSEWQVVTRAEEVLDRPLAPLLLDSPLDRTADAQLAVLLVSLMTWEAVRSAVPEPVAVAGHSLGQLTALVAAGALAFEAGVQLVAERARVTQAAADRAPGGMAALLGSTPEQLDAALAAAPGACWLANDNAPGQVVLAGTRDGLDAAVAAARAAGTRKVMPLAVDGAFHTPLMDDARAALAAYLDGVPFAAPAVPVVSNGDAQPHEDDDGWPARLADHVVQPVRWRESVETMVALGADSLVEVGPGRALAGMAKRIAREVRVETADELVGSVR